MRADLVASLESRWAVALSVGGQGLGEVVESEVLESETRSNLVLEASDLASEVGSDVLKVVGLESVAWALSDKLVDLVDVAWELALDDEDELQGDADALLGVVLLLELVGIVELGKQLLVHVVPRLVRSVALLSTLSKINQLVLQVVSESGGVLEVLEIDLVGSEAAGDQGSKVALKGVKAGSLSLSLELGSQLADELVKSRLELAGAEDGGALLGEALAQAELEFELNLDDNAQLDAVVVLISWSWESSNVRSSCIWTSWEAIFSSW